MTEAPIREPDQIRQNCARKLRSVETSNMFTALLGARPGEDWTTPRIEELPITPGHCLLDRPADDATVKVFHGAEANLIRNIHGLSAVAELDGDEIGYLLGRVAQVKRIE